MPLFDKYLLVGVKVLDFNDWCKAAELMKKGANLTLKGLEKIRQIKMRMNRRRN